MTSGDNGVDMMRLEMLLREHFARTDKQLSEMRADNAEFRAQMLKEQREFETRIEAKFDAFEAKQEAKFEAFEAKQDARFERLEAKQDARFEKLEAKNDTRFERLETRFDSLTAEVVELQRETVGIKHDVAGLYHWNYWIISIILAIVVMPHVVAALKFLASGLAGLISGVLSLFRQNRE